MLERPVTNLTKGLLEVSNKKRKRVKAERPKPSYYFNTIYLYTSFQNIVNIFNYVAIDRFYFIIFEYVCYDYSYGSTKFLSFIFRKRLDRYMKQVYNHYRNLKGDNNMKNFDILREGDFVYNPTDGDALKCVVEDYYRTGEKIPCLCDENYIWPVSEICADDYKLLHRFEEKDVVSIKWVSEYTAVIKMMDKTIWLATRQSSKDALELSRYLFDSDSVLFYYDEEKEYHGVKCNGRVTYFTKEEFAEY